MESNRPEQENESRKHVVAALFISGGARGSRPQVGPAGSPGVALENFHHGMFKRSFVDVQHKQSSLIENVRDTVFVGGQTQRSKQVINI